jgi:hypothetical protein
MEHTPIEEHVRLLVTALEAEANGIIITDRERTTLWVNLAFTCLTDDSSPQVLGQFSRRLKSGTCLPRPLPHGQAAPVASVRNCVWQGCDDFPGEEP